MISHGKAPESIKGPGQMQIGYTEDGFVRIQFYEPDWWCDLTPGESVLMANLLLKKAAQVLEDPNVKAHP